MPYTSFDTPAEFFNISPTTGGLTVGAGTITFGCSDNTTVANRFLTNLSTNQAALSTGSTAQVIFGLLDAIQTRFNAIPTADRPEKLQLTRSVSTDFNTGELVYTYNVTCRVAATGLVAANT